MTDSHEKLHWGHKKRVSADKPIQQLARAVMPAIQQLQLRDKKMRTYFLIHDHKNSTLPFTHKVNTLATKSIIADAQYDAEKSDTN